MFFNCVEPAHDNVGRDYYDWKFTIQSGLGHHIVFPHVDSCLGVVCQLAPGRVFAGHINGFFNNDFSPASHQAAFQNLVAQMGGAPVQRAAIFGDVDSWRGFVHIPWPTIVAFRSMSCAQGVDVLFNVDSGNLQVMRYLANRNYRVPALPGVVAAVNLYGVVASSTVVC